MEPVSSFLFARPQIFTIVGIQVFQRILYVVKFRVLQNLFKESQMSNTDN